MLWNAAGQAGRFRPRLPPMFRATRRSPTGRQGRRPQRRCPPASHRPGVLACAERSRPGGRRRRTDEPALRRGLQHRPGCRLWLSAGDCLRQRARHHQRHATDHHHRPRQGAPTLHRRHRAQRGPPAAATTAWPPMPRTSPPAPTCHYWRPLTSEPIHYRQRWIGWDLLEVANTPPVGRRSSRGSSIACSQTAPTSLSSARGHPPIRPSSPPSSYCHPGSPCKVPCGWCSGCRCSRRTCPSLSVGSVGIVIHCFSWVATL